MDEKKNLLHLIAQVSAAQRNTQSFYIRTGSLDLACILHDALVRLGPNRTIDDILADVGPVLIDMMGLEEDEEDSLRRKLEEVLNNRRYNRGLIAKNPDGTYSGTD